MVINIGLGSRILALQNSVSLYRLVGCLLGSAELLCKGPAKLETRL